MGSVGNHTRGLSGRFLELGILVAAILVISAPLLPPVDLTPNRDSGVYLYVAQRMLAGDALYRDVWDHKPPLVYLPSLAAALLGQPLWGLWALAVTSLGGAVWLLGSGLRSRFGRVPAAWGVAAALVLLAATFKGNLPEEHALPVQVLAILGYSRLASGESVRPRLTGALVGVLGALTVLLKPTLVGLWVAMGILALASQDRSAARLRMQAFWAAIGGGALVLAGAGVVLLSAGLWHDFWSAVIEYNLAYAAGGDRWARWSDSLVRLGPAGLLALGGVALLYLLAFLAWRRRGHLPGAASLPVGGAALAALAVIDLPIEALLAAGSGRLYLQYLTPWVPAIALLAAVAAIAWLTPRLRTGADRWALAALLAGLVAVSALTAGKIASRRAEAQQVRLAVETIESTTTPEAPVLVWGAETQVLALSGRIAPGRYAYLYPLITIGFADGERVGRFADDLRAMPPALIIDTSSTNPVVPPIDPVRRTAWTSSDAQYAAPAELEPVMEWILANYRRAAPVGAWEMYVPNTP